MKLNRTYLYGAIMALPLIGVSFYLLNPPQCPLDYTQEQIDASRCIVGANIGGMPLFILSVPVILLITIWAVAKIRSRKDT